MFQGFNAQTCDFFMQLRFNNNKQWFEDNRGVFNTHVLEPLKELCIELTPTILSIDPELNVTPNMTGAISRIYRDTRFSNDKSPLRDHMWLIFKRRGDDCTTMGFYFEIGCERIIYGMGMYGADIANMNQYRERIGKRPQKWLAIALRSEKRFTLMGEDYVRSPYTGSDVLKPYVDKKHMYWSCERPVDQRCFTSALADEVKSGFELLGNVYKFLVL